MLTDDALRFFGSKTKLAIAAGVSQAAVSRWCKDGIIPKGSAAVLAAGSKGALKFDTEFYQRLKTKRQAELKQYRKGDLIDENHQGDEQNSACP